MKYLRTFFVLIILLSAPLFPAARENGSFRTVRYDESNGLSGAYTGGGIQDRYGLLWFATFNGLNCYDGYEFHKIKIRPGDRAAIGTNHIRDILLSEEGNIVCRTDDDIYEYDLTTYSFHDISPERKNNFRDKVGKQWPGLTDTQGSVWTSDRTGLYQSFAPHHPARMLEGTSGEHARALLVDRDSMLWVGLRNHPCIRIYDRTGKVVRTTVLETAPYCIYQTRSGTVWLGCKPGALMRGEDLISSDAVYDMAEDSRGRLWIATFGSGIRCCPDPDAATPELSHPFGGYKVRKVLVTPSDRIVAATTDGLLVGEIDADDWRRTKLRAVKRDGNRMESLCSNSTMSVARDSKGRIIVGTESSGIEIVDEESLMGDMPEFRHLNMRNSSLTDDICQAMTLASDTLLMIVGNDHIMAFNPVTEQTVNFSRTFWNDTCHFAETTPVMLPDGSWAFGAEEGAFVATPHNLYSRGYVPPLVFTTLSVNGQPEDFCLVPRDTLWLGAGERNVSIRFAAIDYIDNSDILYRSRLDDSPWTEAGRTRNVTLFNLVPGTHVLEVQSTDRYGRPVDNRRSLVLVVAPYWYETWWAKLLLVLAIAACLAGAGYTIVYVRRVNRQRRELLERYIALIGEREKMPEYEEIPAVDEPDADVSLVKEQKPEDSAFLNRVRRYIEENIGNADANVDDMAEAAAASRSTLNRRLRSQLGISAAQLLIEARMQRAEQLLRDCEGENVMPVAEIAGLCGYSDVQYFQRVFKKKHGLTPTDFRADALTQAQKSAAGSGA